MTDQSRTGIVVGSVSIAFSSLCFLVTPVFTAAMVVAPLVGVVSGAVAMACKARRAALAAVIFSLAPVAWFLALKYFATNLGAAYVMLIPMGVANIVAAWALIRYSRKYGSSPSAPCADHKIS